MHLPRPLLRHAVAVEALFLAEAGEEADDDLSDFGEVSLEGRLGGRVGEAGFEADA